MTTERIWKQGDKQDVTRVANCFCPNCGADTAETTVLPTNIPLFQEVILLHLSCSACGFRSTEVKFGGEIQEKGQRIEFNVTCEEDLNLQMVKSDSATFSIPSLKFEIPPSAQRGVVSTLEGFLTTAANNLQQQQKERLQLGDLDNFHRCQTVINALRTLIACRQDVETSSITEAFSLPFSIVLDDPAGNSFLENRKAPEANPSMVVYHYTRTPEQDLALGLPPSRNSQSIDEKGAAATSTSSSSQHTIQVDGTSLAQKEVMKFATTCPHCGERTETDMCITSIPRFKEIIIMCMLCAACGYRSSEIKGGGAIPKQGTCIALQICDRVDLEREVLKSDTGSIVVPELGLEFEEGSLGGFYTTVDGTFRRLKQHLEKSNPFVSGDSAQKQHSSNDGESFSEASPEHERFQRVIQRLYDMEKGKEYPYKLVISDPLSNSFIGPRPDEIVERARISSGEKPLYPVIPDENLSIDYYERTTVQNEILGLLDIQTQDYK